MVASYCLLCLSYFTDDISYRYGQTSFESVISTSCGFWISHRNAKDMEFATSLRKTRHRTTYPQRKEGALLPKSTCCLGYNYCSCLLLHFATCWNRYVIDCFSHHHNKASCWDSFSDRCCCRNDI